MDASLPTDIYKYRTPTRCDGWKHWNINHLRQDHKTPGQGSQIPFWVSTTQHTLFKSTVGTPGDDDVISQGLRTVRTDSLGNCNNNNNSGHNFNFLYAIFTRVCNLVDGKDFGRVSFLGRTSNMVQTWQHFFRQGFISRANMVQTWQHFFLIFEPL